MSIEAEIKNLTAAVVALVETLRNQGSAPVVQSPPVIAAPVAPAVPAPTAPVMPPLPFNVTPIAPPVAQAPVATAPVCPIKDAAAMMQYVVESFQALGTEKGAAIGTLLQQLGVHDISSLKAEQYGTLWAGIEQLKAG